MSTLREHEAEQEAITNAWEAREAEQAQHTPGPWEATTSAGILAVFSEAVRLGDSRIAEVLGRTTEEAEANARLIAAAPALMAALEELVAEFDEKDRIAQGEPGGMGIVPTGGIIDARQAIAQARGEEAGS